VTFGYLGKRALLGMRQSPYGAAVATITIALALFAVGAMSAAGLLASHALGAWGSELKLTVYLEDGASPEQRAAVQRHLGGSAHFLSKADALASLKTSLGQLGAVLDDLPQNPLRDSFDTPVGSLAPAAIAALAGALGQLAGVADVDYGAEWLAPVQRLLRFLRLAGLSLLGLVVVATVVLVSNTFHLAVYARRDEIGIMKLVGATDAFIRIPFLIEGLLEGVCGGLLAAAALGTSWGWLWPRAIEAVGLLAALGPTPLSLARALGGLVLTGGLLGLCASGLAVGRFLRV
jgi:cell division transport system permease protein